MSAGPALRDRRLSRRLRRQDLLPRGPARPRGASIPLAALSHLWPREAVATHRNAARNGQRPRNRRRGARAPHGNSLAAPAHRPPRQQPREGCPRRPTPVDAERNDRPENHGGSHSVRRRPPREQRGHAGSAGHARHDDAADGRDGDGQDYGRQKEEADQ